MIDKQNNKHTLITLVLMVLLTSGCSAAYVSNWISPQCTDSGWKEIMKSLYKCEFKCGNGSIFVRSFPVDTAGFIGPPLLPVIPLHIKGQTKLLFEVRRVAQEGNLLDGPFDIVVKQPHDQKDYSPIKVIDLLKDDDVIKEEGLSHMGFPPCDGSGNPCRSFLYTFDIDSKLIEEFDIVFLSDYMGCSVPKMHYKKTRKSGYHPLAPPGG